MPVDMDKPHFLQSFTEKHLFTLNFINMKLIRASSKSRVEIIGKF